MPEWLSHPATIIILLVTVIGAVIKFSRWTAAVDADRTAFKKFMEEIREKIDTILDRLPPRATTAMSPLRLTSLGQEISKYLDAGTVADALAPGLQERTKGMDAYQIQELCLEFVRREFKPQEELDILIRTSAFEHGLKRDQILDVIAIELRERLLLPGTPPSAEPL